MGPRDYVAISGENWPVDNTDNSNSALITIEIAEGGRTRSYSVYADNTGRFSIEHRVSKDVGYSFYQPGEGRATAKRRDSGSRQLRGAVGDGYRYPWLGPAGRRWLALSATDMPVYASADYVKIGGTVFNDPGANTDIDGNITIDGLLVPGLDPGTYSVVLNVDGTVAIGEVEVLAEDSAAGAGAELPGALEAVGRQPGACVPLQRR